MRAHIPSNTSYPKSPASTQLHGPLLHAYGDVSILRPDLAASMYHLVLLLELLRYGLHP